MPVNTEQFLEIYAQALNTFDPKLVSSFCIPPTIIMNDYGKKVLTTESEVLGSFERRLGQLQDYGVTKLVPTLHQTIRLSDSLFFSKVRWQFFDKQDILLFGCATSYTLQRMPDKSLKIIVVVIDDTDNALSKVFPV